MSSASKAPSTRSRATNELVEVGKTVFYALLIALVLRVLLFQPFTIPSASMEPTLLEGDYIIVSKYSYGFSKHSIPLSPPIFNGRILFHAPQRGDVIVFKLPRDNKTDYIKRLIGLPGDHIQVRKGVVFVNNRPIAQTPQGQTTIDLGGFMTKADVIREKMSNGRTFLTYSVDPSQPPENTDVFVVPEGNYFFMGDNRDNSLDSRFPKENDGVGFVPAENLEGKAQIILLSWNKGASLFKPWTWVLDARGSRFFHYLY
ncbi:MAG TPA: signal peptidase I [Caulobacteraceae bacterium]